VVIRSRFPDVEIPDVSLTHLVLGRAELGEKPAFLDAALGSATLAGRARVRLPEHCFGLPPKPGDLQAGLTPRPARPLSPHAPASYQDRRARESANRGAITAVLRAIIKTLPKGGCCHVDDVGL
jgi:hypothetical protein